MSEEFPRTTRPGLFKADHFVRLHRHGMRTEDDGTRDDDPQQAVIKIISSSCETWCWVLTHEANPCAIWAIRVL